jgi:HAMP domain
VRLRTQILLATCGTALVCGVIGNRLVAMRSRTRGLEVLDRELSMSALALDRQAALRRTQLRGILSGVARQVYFRAYMLEGDRGQLAYFAGTALDAGADTVVVTDGAGHTLAAIGNSANELAERLAQPGARHDGVVAIGGALFDVAVQPVGGEQRSGFLIGARRVAPQVLAADATPFGVEAGVEAGGVVVASVPDWIQALAHATPEEVDERTLTIDGAPYRLLVRPLGNARLFVATPEARVEAITSELTRAANVVLFALLVVVAVGVNVVSDRVRLPIERIQQAASDLGAGRFVAAVARLTPLLKRRDEIGALARSYADAAHRLTAMLDTCTRLSSELGRTLFRANKLVLPAQLGTESAPIRELGQAVTSLQQQLADVGPALNDARTQLRAVATELGRADGAVATVTTAAERLRALLGVTEQKLGERDDSISRDLARVMRQVAQQVSALEGAVQTQQRAMQTALDGVAAIRAELDRTITTLFREQHGRALATRTIDQIDRLVRGYAADALTVRTAVTALGQHVDELRNVLLTTGDVAAAGV